MKCKDCKTPIFNPAAIHNNCGYCWACCECDKRYNEEEDEEENE